MKFKNPIAQIFGLIILFGILISVNAQSEDPSNFQKRRQRPFDREEVLKRFDKDGDGKLSEEERQAAWQLFLERRSYQPSAD